MADGICCSRSGADESRKKRVVKSGDGGDGWLSLTTWMEKFLSQAPPLPSWYLIQRRPSQPQSPASPASGFTSLWPPSGSTPHSLATSEEGLRTKRWWKEPCRLRHGPSMLGKETIAVSWRHIRRHCETPKRGPGVTGLGVAGRAARLRDTGSYRTSQTSPGGIPPTLPGALRQVMLSKPVPQGPHWSSIPANQLESLWPTPSIKKPIRGEHVLPVALDQLSLLISDMWIANQKSGGLASRPLISVPNSHLRHCPCPAPTCNLNNRKGDPSWRDRGPKGKVIFP